MLDGLERIGFMDRHRMDVLWPIEPKDTPKLPGYRLGIFQLGNNVEFHLEIYRAAFLTPALVVLHDLALDDFVRGLKTLGEPLGYMAAREAARAAPEPDLARRACGTSRSATPGARTSRAAPAGSSCTPSSASATWRSSGAARRSSSCRTRSSRRPPRWRRVRRAAASCGPSSSARGAPKVIVAPGDLNEAKRLDALLEAVQQLPDDVHVALVGRRISGYDIDRVVEERRLGDRVTLAPDVSDDDFRGWLFAADVIVDLRFPHRGEVSGSLARAMQAGRPAIVSATGTYLDVPDDAVLRVAAGSDEPRGARDTPANAARGRRAARAHGRRREGPHRGAARVRGHRARVRAGDRGDARAGRRPCPQGDGDLGEGRSPTWA